LAALDSRAAAAHHLAMVRRMAVALLAVAALASALALPAAADARYRICAPVRDIGPTGMDPADAVRVRALKTKCHTARRVARASTRVFVRNFDKDYPRVRRYWRCTNRTPLVICRARGGKRIRFHNDG
jgi:hypothetical protein